jgi:hypothetical protein
VGQDSVVSIATRYGLDGLGSKPGLGGGGVVRFSAPVQTGSGTYQALYTMGTGSLSRG